MDAITTTLLQHLSFSALGAKLAFQSHNLGVLARAELGDIFAICKASHIPPSGVMLSTSLRAECHGRVLGFVLSMVLWMTGGGYAFGTGRSMAGDGGLEEWERWIGHVVMTVVALGLLVVYFWGSRFLPQHTMMSIACVKVAERIYGAGPGVRECVALDDKSGEFREKPDDNGSA
jgi:hypothetical protein